MSLTEEKSLALLSSMQKIYILAKCIEIEYHVHAIDTRFVRPEVNMFSKRIKQDSLAIMKHIQARIKVRDTNFAEDYALDINNVIDYFIGLETNDIQDFLTEVEKKIKE